MRLLGRQFEIHPVEADLEHRDRDVFDSPDGKFVERKDRLSEGRGLQEAPSEGHRSTGRMMTDVYDETDEDFEPLQCFRSDRIIPSPEEGQTGRGRLVDGFRRRGRLLPRAHTRTAAGMETFTTAQMREDPVDPAKVPEEFRHLFE